MKEWLTIAEASALVGRHASRIYRWVWAGHLGTNGARENEYGVIEVRLSAVREAEASVRRGRPRGTASRNTRHAERDGLEEIRESRDDG